MPQGPAARITDPVVHPLPPVLTPGPGSFNTIIGFLLAWRGIPLAAAGALQAAKAASDIVIKTAEAATLAAAGTPGAPAAKLAEETIKAQQAAQMGSMITSMAGGADIHMCVTPLPVPPHGPGVVIDGSPTVMINSLPACRMGDTILEAIGPPNKIAMGCPTVIIGQMGSGSSSSAGSGSGTPKSATTPPVQGEAKYEKAGSQAISGPTTVTRDKVVPAGGGGASSAERAALTSGAQSGQAFLPKSVAPTTTPTPPPPAPKKAEAPKPVTEDPVKPPNEECIIEAKIGGAAFILQVPDSSD